MIFWSLCYTIIIMFIAGLFAVLLIGDMFKPLDGAAVQFFLNGDMRHRGR